MTKKLTHAQEIANIKSDIAEIRKENAETRALLQQIANAVLAPQPTPKTKKNAGKKPAKKAAPKAVQPKAEPNLRLAKDEAIALMVKSWHNRAAAAYGRKHDPDANLVWADLTAKERKGITNAQKEQALKDLLASDKWARTSKRHGLTVDDLAW